MKQAYILPIQKQWVDMIRSGVKEYEFRPYALEVGKKVYIYETLGKKIKRGFSLYHLEIKKYAKLVPCNENSEYYQEYGCKYIYEFASEEPIYYDDFHKFGVDWDEDEKLFVRTFDNGNDYNVVLIERVETHKGTGAIVGEFVVEECYETHWRGFGEAEPMEIHFEKQFVDGTNLHKVEKAFSEFDDYNGLLDIGYDGQKYAIKISQLKWYDKPIPKEEFELYNKMEKLDEELYKMEHGQICGIPIDYASFTHYTQWEKDRDNYGKVTHAPQRAIKVVEREDL